MQRMSTQESVQFVVTSDAAQNTELFNGLDVIFASGRKGGDGHYMESFFELSMCSVILSPPSSFALMAAYVGGGSLINISTFLHQGSDTDAKILAIESCRSDPDFSKVS